MQQVCYSNHRLQAESRPTIISSYIDFGYILYIFGTIYSHIHQCRIQLNISSSFGLVLCPAEDMSLVYLFGRFKLNVCILLVFRTGQKVHVSDEHNAFMMIVHPFDFPFSWRINMNLTKKIHILWIIMNGWNTKSLGPWDSKYIVMLAICSLTQIYWKLTHHFYVYFIFKYSLICYVTFCVIKDGYHLHIKRKQVYWCNCYTYH